MRRSSFSSKTAPAAAASLLCFALIACGGGNPASPSPSSPSPSPSPAPVPSPSPSPPSPSGGPAWNFDGAAWVAATGTTPPACPGPLVLRTPVDLSVATSILYPGQVRGEYKAHGGFRFDRAGQTTEARVTAPLDGMVYRGARYMEDGELQILIDVINACGLMYRFDHLRTLSPRFQQIAEAFPVRGDTRTTFAPPGQMVSTGEVIATGIGRPGNVGVDFGVYDLRQPNASSRDPGWLASHPGEHAAFGVCWLDLLGSDSGTARGLPPGDQANGRTSDYCR